MEYRCYDASVSGSAGGKVKCSGETAGTEPERNDRRRAADGSKRDCVFHYSSATRARYAAAERALVADVEPTAFAF
ncbi:MAG: hypothetical protein ABR955_12065 [Verrucomicrobiota bacterium]